MDSLTLLRVLGGLVWIGLALITAPAIFRLVLHRSRSLDAIWAAGFFLCLNRLSFLVDAMVAGGGLLRWCYATSIAAALAYGGVVWSFQRHDS